MTAIGPPSSVEMAEDMLSADEWDQVRGLWTEALAAMLPAWQGLATAAFRGTRSRALY